MRRIPLILVAGAVLLSYGCESDERKLVRLKRSAAERCLPVFREDSAEQADELLIARINAGVGSYSNVSEAQRDLDMARKVLAKRQAIVARMQADSAGFAREEKKKDEQRIKCELAQRNLQSFMNGK